MARAAAALLIVLGAACDGTKAPADDSVRAADPSPVETRGRLVSVVDGSPIELRELQRLVRALGLSVPEALRRAQDERLLAAVARKRGYDNAQVVTRVVRQFMVQQLLESEVEQVTIGQQQLQAAYEEAGERFVRPERRRVSHVLAKLEANAPTKHESRARAFVLEAIRRLKTQSAREVRAWARAEQGLPFLVVVEQLPPFDLDGPFVEAFKQPVFGASAPGVIEDPVRTQFGWHAVLLEEVLPALEVPLEDAAEELRGEVRRAEQKKRLEALVARLRVQSSVQLHQEALMVLERTEGDLP